MTWDGLGFDGRKDTAEDGTRREMRHDDTRRDGNENAIFRHKAREALIFTRVS